VAVGRCAPGARAETPAFSFSPACRRSRSLTTARVDHAPGGALSAGIPRAARQVNFEALTLSPTSPRKGSLQPLRRFELDASILLPATA